MAEQPASVRRKADFLDDPEFSGFGLDPISWAPDSPELRGGGDLLDRIQQEDDVIEFAG
jgi:hypothetical protein